MMFSRLAERLRAVARVADVRPRKPKPDPMREVDAALGLTEREQSGSETPKSGQIAPSGKFDRETFFAVLRQGPLRHRVPSQVMGTEAILTAMAGKPLAWTAYALATAWHETGYTMQPIKEKGGRAYFMRMYDKTGERPGVARALGNTVAGDGATYAGRGYVQLTGRRNYGFAERKLGEPLLSNPDLAMRPDIAARILREGMTDAWFTGRGFASMLTSVGPATKAAFAQARRIINGMDRAAKIADEAVTFQAALIAGGWE